ncbi:MAG: Ig-like domain-containing protein, partial [Pseudomonadota bacterium]
AVVTVTDGIGGTATAARTDDGSFSIDLSALADGPLTTEVVATDAAGNTATVAGPGLTLDTVSPPGDADEGDDLALTSDGGPVIDASEMTAAVFRVSGLDGDATAVASFSDGAGGLVEVLFTGDGARFVNLSGLAEGPIAATITATDAGGATATGTAPALTLDKSSGLNVVVQTGAAYDGTAAADLIEASDTAFPTANEIDSGAGNDFVFGGAGNDTIRGDNGGDQLFGGAGQDRLFGRNEPDLIFGGADRDFLYGGNADDTIEGGEGDDQLRGEKGADDFLYDAAPGADLGDDRLHDFDPGQNDRVVNVGVPEAALVLYVSGSGVLFGSVRESGGDLAAALAAPELGTMEFRNAGLAAGAEAPEIEAYFGGPAGFAAAFDGWGAVLIDAPSGAPDLSADEDGNLALAAPDTAIDVNEVGAVAFPLPGLDADADAVVTVTDGIGGTASAARTGDGSFVLDLSALADGPLTTEVVATDAAGNTATVAGPGLTLDTTPIPDTSADEDGNLALAAPDLAIDVNEVGAVAFTLTGLDADADAVVTVTDGIGGTATAARTDDGSFSIDLSALADGPLTTEVVATDAAGN